MLDAILYARGGQLPVGDVEYGFPLVGIKLYASLAVTVHKSLGDKGSLTHLALAG